MALEALKARLSALKLGEELGAKYASSISFQQALARQLRKVAMGIIAGTLTDSEGQPVDSDAVSGMREQLRSGVAAARDCSVKPMSNLPPSGVIKQNELYIGFQPNGDITYQTSRSQGVGVIKPELIEAQLEGEQLRHFREAVETKNTAKLLGFENNILAITDQLGHTKDDSAIERSLEAYLQDQSGQYAEATNGSLGALADALDVNVVWCDVNRAGVVEQQHRLNDASFDATKPTLCITGGYGHWNAVVDCDIDAQGVVKSGRVVHAHGDGSCGYNAIALGLAAITGSRNAPTPAVAEPSARAASGAEKVTQAEPWKERLKSILATTDKADMEGIQKAAIGGGSLESIVRQKILETQLKALPAHLRQLTDTEAGKVKDGAPSVLTPEQQAIEEQIKVDEKLAWELAGQEALKDDESDEERGQFRP